MRRIVHFPFGDLLISLSIMFSKFIQVIANVRIIFLSRSDNILLHVYTTFISPFHPSMDNWVAVVNSAAMNMGIQIPL
jgi:hypothetical protein